MEPETLEFATELHNGNLRGTQLPGPGMLPGVTVFDCSTYTFPIVLVTGMRLGGWNLMWSRVRQSARVQGSPWQPAQTTVPMHLFPSAWPELGGPQRGDSLCLVYSANPRGQRLPRQPRLIEDHSVSLLRRCRVPRCPVSLACQTGLNTPCTPCLGPQPKCPPRSPP